MGSKNTACAASGTVHFDGYSPTNGGLGLWPCATYTNPRSPGKGTLYWLVVWIVYSRSRSSSLQAGLVPTPCNTPDRNIMEHPQVASPLPFLLVTPSASTRRPARALPIHKQDMGDISSAPDVPFWCCRQHFHAPSGSCLMGMCCIVNSHQHDPCGVRLTCRTLHLRR